MDDTIIVFSGDQGTMFGDLGIWGKGVFHRGSVGSPLVIAGPGVAAGTVVDRPAELIDLAPTPLELAGASPDDLRRCYGQSLLPRLTGRGKYARRFAFDERHGEKMAFDGRYKHVQAEQPLLFDVQEYPRELSSVLGRLPEVEARMKQALADCLAATPPVLPPNGRRLPARAHP